MSQAQPSGADTLSLRLPAELPKLLWLPDWLELRLPPANVIQIINNEFGLQLMIYYL